MDSKTEVAFENEDLESVVSELAEGQKPQRHFAIRELFKAAAKLAKESPGTLNLKIASTVMKELRYSFKMFYPDRHIQKITIFGSARIPNDKPLYRLAKQFASDATKRSYKVITGGGPGVMEAGNEGATSKGSYGLNIRLPHEQEANKYIDQKRSLIHYKYFFTRKLFLVKEASAFALFPGGFGTMDETFEVFTLLQTGKTPIIPVVLMEPKGYTYWKNFIKFVDKELLGRHLISPSDRALYQICHTPKEALDHIDHFYKNYHSMRIVKDKLVIRLKKPLANALIPKINKRFGYLAEDGKIFSSKPLKEESNEPEVAELPRLVFKFDRRDFAGLRLLIDFINSQTV